MSVNSTRVPKKAPAWRTETTLEEMVFFLDVMG
jgi:hypothetical protein